MNHRFLVSVSGLVVPAAVVWLATMPVAGQTRSAGARTNGSPAKAYTAPRTPRRPAGSAGHLVEHHDYASGAAEERHQGVLHPEEALEAAKRAAARGERADRTRHRRRRAL